MSDAAHPFLLNCWYVAATDVEVTQQPFQRVLLDRPVVMYRRTEGAPVALYDRCPHRFAPLSLGRRVGDNLQCIYHGLQFGPHGACVHNPHDPNITSRMRVDSYPLTERYGYVWIWFGEAAAADPALLPDLGFLEDPRRFRSVRGQLSIDAHYELVTDNLLDLSHVEFLHPLFARDEGVEGHRVRVARDGSTVIAERWKPNTSLNAFARLFWDRSEDRGDGRANMRWTPPSTLAFDLGVTHVGGALEDGVCTPAAHLITPETLRRTHYFWAQARNRRLDDTSLDHQLIETTSRVFEQEDRLVIEAQQRAMGQETDIMKLKPMLLNTDGPPVMARRILAKLIAEEIELYDIAK